MVPNIKDTGEDIQTAASITIPSRIHPIYTGNTYNEALHNAIGMEQEITAIKSWSQVGVDIALVTNNVSQLFWLKKANNNVWPNTLQRWCLVASLILQFIAFCIQVVDAGVKYFTCCVPNTQKIRRNLNAVICGFLYVVTGVNFVIQGNGWEGPISINPFVHCSNSTTEDTPH